VESPGFRTTSPTIKNTKLQCFLFVNFRLFFTFIIAPFTSQFFNSDFFFYYLHYTTRTQSCIKKWIKKNKKNKMYVYYLHAIASGCDRCLRPLLVVDALIKRHALLTMLKTETLGFKRIKKLYLQNGDFSLIFGVFSFLKNLKKDYI